MSKIIDRALDIINDRLKTQTSELSPTMEVRQGMPGMAHGGHVLEDDYPTHYLPDVGRQVMADGGMPAGRPDISQYLQQIQAQQAPMRQAPAVSDYAYTGAARPQGYEPNRPSWVAPTEYVQSFQGGSPTPYVYGYEPPKPTPGPALRAAPSGGGGGIDPMQMMFLMRAMRGFADGGMPDDDDPVARALQTAQSVSQEPMPDMTPRPTKPSVPSAEGRVTAPKQEEPTEPEGMTAYHGTPHEFEQFDTSKIGTGEGAQAYGHGLYFAENENVAKDYRDRLTDKASSFRVENIDMPKWILRKIESHPDRAQAISEIRNDFQNRLVEAEEEAKGSHQPWMASGKISTAKDVLAGLDKIETGANIPHTRGRMYEVNLDVGPEHLLDWDKPLSEQHPNIIRAIRDTISSAEEDAVNPNALRGNFQGSGSTQYGTSEDHDHLTGAAIHDMISRVYGHKNQSEELSKRGIRGIRYLDAGSRGKDGESGSHNYVIFDPQHIKVKRRYAEGGGVKAYFMHAPQDLLDRAKRAYGGAIAGPKLTEENAEDFARRLILWSYAAAPFVNRSIHRATGGEVDPSVDQALDAARGASQADPAASAMETARSLTPMGFYSAAAEAASKIPQRAPIDQIINKVKGSPGVKAEELDWSGVKDAFAGQRSVDPQEVARHFQANLPALQETVKADPEVIAQKLATQRQSLLMQGKKDEADALMDQIKKVYDTSWKSENAAKYGKYTLPDGRNYREVLLHLPNEEGDLYKQISQARQDRIDAVREHGSVLKYDDLDFEQERLQKIREATQRENDLREKLKSVRKGQSYKSSHWNIPDVVAHLRLSDRDMGKTLHMEELQSDWGQEGRDEGFNDQKAETRRKELYDLINKVKGDRAEETNKVHSEFKENSKEFNSAYDDLIRDEHKIFSSSKFNQRDVDRYNEATDAALEKTKHLLEPAEKEKQKSLLEIDQKYGPLIEKIERELNSLPKVSSDSPPSAPHVTSSEGWTDLGLKRALQEAAKGGYNKLVWTPGQAQADRYDLSQQVKHIMWSPDNKILSALTHDGYDAVGKQVEKEDLHKYIGKEAAKRLLDQEPEIDGNMATHHLRGQDISVGAEGMKNYYDRFVPKRLGKLVSSLDPDAKIEMHAHELPGDEEGETVMGHVLHITPKLRAAILKGLPAYKQGGFATNSAPIVNKALEAIKNLGG